jgi:hypothetical protein
MSLLYAGQQFTIYVGFFLLFMGIAGNALNIFIFVSVRNYRTTPCTFYFLVALIYDMAELVIHLLARIVNTGFGITAGATSTIWCKARPYTVSVFGVITMTCQCLATIDQFLVTSSSARLRQWSKIKWAHRTVIGLMIIACIYGIPWLFYEDISPISGQCVYTTDGFYAYVLTQNLGIICAVPVLVMATFGYLTYRNIRQTTTLAQHQADRQLATMVFMQIISVAFSRLPYGAYFAYSFFTTGVIKDKDRLNKEQFASTVIAALSYTQFAVCLFFER